jgi:ATP-dependent Clp protease ATP-binding subunit ClpB
VYGARPLRRLVQSAIGDQLAKALLAGEIRDGDEVVVDWPDDVTGTGEGGLTVRRG